MRLDKANTVGSYQALRQRVSRLFTSPMPTANVRQLTLPLAFDIPRSVRLPTDSLQAFIDFLAAALPVGGVYLFGGVIRDLALVGRHGFKSDVDIVVEGDWTGSAKYLESLGAVRNKFGGYRLMAGQWPVDIWNAEETWAVREGFVSYTGVQALTRTTVLNWDAILMDWRSKRFICRSDYLESLQQRALDIVLEANPNPRGMAVRVFRHLSMRDARHITHRAADYLESCAERYTLAELVASEIASYGNSVIEPALYRLFLCSRARKEDTVAQRMMGAAKTLEVNGVAPEWKQFSLRIQAELGSPN